MTGPTPPAHRGPLALGALSLLALVLPGCVDTDPATETGIDKPAVTGVITGDIKTRRELADAIEAKNKTNAERQDKGDWRYAKPAVGRTE